MFFSMWGLLWVHSAYPYYPDVVATSTLSEPSFTVNPEMSLSDTVKHVAGNSYA